MEAEGALWAVSGLPAAAARIAIVPARPDPIAGAPPPRAMGTCVVHRGSLFVIGGSVLLCDEIGFVGLWDCWRFTPDDAEARCAHGAPERLLLRAPAAALRLLLRTRAVRVS